MTWSDNYYIDISEVALCGHPGVSDAEWGDDGEDNVPSVLPLLSNTMSAKASYLHTVLTVSGDSGDCGGLVTFLFIAVSPHHCQHQARPPSQI